METPRVFLDTEFTGLVKDTELISLGLYIDEDNYFYAEFNDWDRKKSFEFLETDVIPKLEFNHITSIVTKQENAWKLKGNKKEIESELNLWFKQFSVVEIWADVLAYDWVLFCQIFGGAFHIPENIFYAPFDLATLFRMKGLITPKGKYDRDVPRYEYAGVDNALQHHALEDAKVESLCYKKLINHD